MFELLRLIKLIKIEIQQFWSISSHQGLQNFRFRPTNQQHRDENRRRPTFWKTHFGSQLKRTIKANSGWNVLAIRLMQVCLSLVFGETRRAWRHRPVEVAEERRRWQCFPLIYLHLPLSADRMPTSSALSWVPVLLWHVLVATTLGNAGRSEKFW